MTLTSRTITSLAAATAVLTVFVVPLCGALMVADLCPMTPPTAATDGTTCHRVAQVVVEAPTIDCCLTSASDPPPALPSVTLPAIAPPMSSPLVALPVARQAAFCDTRTTPPPLDLRSLHSSLLL